ncbi:Ferric enterobactin transport ATP-binding protein FepC [Corynebacterium deserti GIMN1.010]|uniref:Ferric enterobactin transport ATP-binding protein FepC n=1 Tax=Corynebacterium deserti GIMN1.010 TaxID=931089 RepID=A0A0M5II94_9CORY|nr:ABC transporter ATP-binding protein [Corynebacterium deserti]ALC04998.1 Ferric enterobactin transport ATP-binding protein FepC [Corynebacterium deserti GIMN1.010]
MTTTSRLAMNNVTIGYDNHTIARDLKLAIPDRTFTAIIGPNGCGKSTLLRGFARVIRPQTGQVLFDEKSLDSYKPKDLARELGLLPQTSIAPEGIRVYDLVARGRAPYQSLLRQWSPEDEEAVTQALAATNLTELSTRLVDQLSGGQRQRVWVAMLLAQQTPIMLLDEPTTFLDISHQFELLDLLRDLNHAGKTVITVLHDLNQASRYADHLIVMKDGHIHTTGSPQEVITPELVHDVFGLDCMISPDPVTGTPAVFPLAKTHNPAV